MKTNNLLPCALIYLDGPSISFSNSPQLQQGILWGIVIPVGLCIELGKKPTTYENVKNFAKTLQFEGEFCRIPTENEYEAAIALDPEQDFNDTAEAIFNNPEFKVYAAGWGGYAWVESEADERNRRLYCRLSDGVFGRALEMAGGAHDRMVFTSNKIIQMFLAK